MTPLLLALGASSVYAAAVVRRSGGRWLAYRVLVRVLLWLGVALLALALYTSHGGVT